MAIMALILKYSNISLINSFRQLNNAEPVIHKGTIQTAPSVNSNLYVNVSADIKVSDSLVINRNIEVLTCCKMLQEHLVQGHCCAYSHSIVHQDVICHSTESALLSIKNDVHLAFAKGEATAVVLLDQSAAFDTIDHDMLLDSLSSWFGVSGVVLDWFKSYLSDRVQCIKIGSILSDAKKLLYGVPQGSVLGPILFSLYTTPLSKVIQNHRGISFQFYADDTQLYVHLTHKNAASALDKLSRCLEDVKRWLSTNKLKLNPDKTEFIVFGSNS